MSAALVDITVSVLLTVDYAQYLRRFGPSAWDTPSGTEEGALTVASELVRQAARDALRGREDWVLLVPPDAPYYIDGRRTV